MDLFRTRLITQLLAFGLSGSALMGALLYYVFPNWFPNWYVGTLAFFILLEILVVGYAETSSRTATARQMLNVYMLTKVIKIFASLIFVAIYAFTIRVGLKSFILVFMLLYLLFLGIEGYLFLKIEDRLKEKQQKE